MRQLPRLTRAALVFLFTSLAAVPLHAEEGKSSVLNDYVISGGVIGVVILLMSVAVLALTIEHFISLRRIKIIPTNLLEDLEDVIGEGDMSEEDFQEALDICERERNPLAQVMLNTLQKVPYGYETTEEALVKSMDGATVALNNKISYLGLIAAVAPMMGLFGTVYGMIGAFKVIANEPNVSAKSVAGQIQVALVTTFLGLLVAIPSLGLSFFFQNRVLRLVSDLQTVCDDLIVRLRPDDA